jgi:hypothetical protein
MTQAMDAESEALTKQEFVAAAGVWLVDVFVGVASFFFFLAGLASKIASSIIRVAVGGNVAVVFCSKRLRCGGFTIFLVVLMMEVEVLV